MKNNKCLSDKLIKEWHPTKNGDLKPSDVSFGSHKKVWWLGECGHEWIAKVNHRSKGTGCPMCSRKKALNVHNSLLYNYPQVAQEWDNSLNGFGPESITPGSNKKVWWKCSKGHCWQDTISHRTAENRKCPYCSNHKVLAGFNDLATTTPELLKDWDFEKNVVKPEELSKGSRKKIWWKCRNGHDSYELPVYLKSNGAGCPVCSKVFQTSFPEQAILYYVKKCFPDACSKFRDIFNNSMELDIFIPSINTAIEYDGSFWHNEKTWKRENRKYAICKEKRIKLIRFKENGKDLANADIVYFVPNFTFKNRERLENEIKKMLNNIGVLQLPQINIEKDKFEIYEYRTLNYEDSLEFTFPEISEEWYQELNGKITPRNVLPGSCLAVWWKCRKCGKIWKATIVNRTKGHGCDNCAWKERKRTHHETILKTRDLLTNCSVVIDWDYSKNQNGPEFYSKGSGEKVWWKCHKCGFEWKTQIHNRTRDYKNGCPACSNRILVKGKNDLATTNPNLILEWNYEKNGFAPNEIAQWSHKKVWWKCPTCGYQYQASVGNKTLGRGCPCCSGRTLVRGKNDLQTLRPDIAMDWHPTLNLPLCPCDVTPGKRDVVWWKCHKCGHEWKDSLNHRSGGRGCSCCRKYEKEAEK